MDATPKKSPVPPTPKLQYFLSPLSRRGVSNLNIAVPSSLPPPPCCALRQRRQRCRIFTRRLPSRFIVLVGDNCCRARKTSSLPTPSPLSLTCLNSACSLRSEELSALGRFFNVLGTECRLHQESSTAAGSGTIPYIISDPAQHQKDLSYHSSRATTIALTIRWTEDKFFTHSVFTPRFQRTFNAYEDLRRTDQRRTVKELHHRLTIVTFALASNISTDSVHKRLIQEYSLRFFNYTNNVTQRCHTAYASQLFRCWLGLSSPSTTVNATATLFIPVAAIRRSASSSSLVVVDVSNFRHAATATGVAARGAVVGRRLDVVSREHRSSQAASQPASQPACLSAYLPAC